MATMEQLERKAAQLKAQILARKNQVRARERKLDTRRKILVGKWLMEHRDTNWVKSQMDDYLERPSDRELFGLPTR